LVLLNFATQIITDIIAARFIDRIGYRKPIVFGFACCAIGFCILAAAPVLFLPVYTALTIGVIISAIGGGLLEVMISPISNALPAEEEKKASNMALLHSFYCWGWMVIVLLSTLFLSIFGNTNWQILTLLWVSLPLVNLFLFTKVPFAPAPHHENLLGIRRLFSAPVFWAAMVLMVCAGASELAVAQWSSLFAEKSLGLSKLAGDLAGPMVFAITMGIGRTIYGIFGEKIKLVPILIVSAALCVASYFMISLAPNPTLSLIGCALTGFSVSLMWPGVLSLTAEKFPMGGTAMFAVLAMSGSLGCAVGPWIAGFVADLSEHEGTIQTIGNTLLGEGDTGLKLGILAAVIFPLLMLFILPIFKKQKEK